MIQGNVNGDLDLLIGMALLERHSLQVDVVNGGAVTIRGLP
jgi:hypothetical protein